MLSLSGNEYTFWLREATRLMALRDMGVVIGGLAPSLKERDRQRYMKALEGAILDDYDKLALQARREAQWAANRAILKGYMGKD